MWPPGPREMRVVLLLWLLLLLLSVVLFLFSSFRRLPAVCLVFTGFPR